MRNNDKDNLVEDRIICNFWMRILALLIDCICLFLIGIFLSIWFSKQFVQMGGWGRLVGFLITICYFGILNSRIGKGQTIGKKITNIHVVGWHGQFISFGRSLLRSGILVLPYFLNKIMLPQLTPILLINIINFIIFGVGIGVIYFYVFNKKTRQSLHDLICKTYVTKTDTTGQVRFNKVARIHYIVFLLCSIFIVIFQVIAVPKLIQKEALDNILVLQKKLYEIEKVSFVSASDMKYVIFTSSGTDTVNTIEVGVRYKEKPMDFERSAREIAQVILNNYPKSRYKDKIGMVIYYGYDIGIIYWWLKFPISLSPSEWEKRLKNQGKQLSLMQQNIKLGGLR